MAQQLLLGFAFLRRPRPQLLTRRYRLRPEAARPGQHSRDAGGQTPAIICSTLLAGACRDSQLFQAHSQRRIIHRLIKR
jgi:hypothetical protein